MLHAVTWHPTCPLIRWYESKIMFITPSTRHWRRCAPAVVALWAIAAANAAGPGFSAGFSAILGGSGQDYAAGVATDAQGNVYVAGLTYSPDFTVTPAALQTKPGGGSDAFVAKFAPDGALLWSTYLGGSGDDWATGVGVDAADNVLVTGWTRSANFPVFHAFQSTLNNGASPARYDAFVAKIDPTGTKLLYSTFLGGEGDDGATGLALDAVGNVYVAGNVQSPAAFPGMKNTSDLIGIFVTKLDAEGALIYSILFSTPSEPRRESPWMRKAAPTSPERCYPPIPPAAPHRLSACRATRRLWCSSSRRTDRGKSTRPLWAAAPGRTAWPSR